MQQDGIIFVGYLKSSLSVWWLIKSELSLVTHTTPSHELHCSGYTHDAFLFQHLPQSCRIKLSERRQVLPFIARTRPTKAGTFCGSIACTKMAHCSCVWAACRHRPTVSSPAQNSGQAVSETRCVGWTSIFLARTRAQSSDSSPSGIGHGIMWRDGSVS